jgi:hypothetical protein
MKELFHFSSLDLMVLVSYSRYLNAIHYFSHRKLSSRERMAVEQYLLCKFALKTEYYEKDNATLKYCGVNLKLVKRMHQSKVQRRVPSLQGKEGQINDAVRDLIECSLSNYYFEQIGNTLMEIRRLSWSFDKGVLMDEYAEKLKELVKAYNLYTENKVSMDKIVPRELSECMK